MPKEILTQPEKFSFSEVDFNDINSVRDYYQFEIDQGFSSVPEKSSFESMAKFRQKQLGEGKMRIAVIKENGATIGTAVLVLENGTMGKNIKEDESWAAGTVVDKDKRSMGVGEKLVELQDEMAIKSGKKEILTTISNDNFASMRLYMKSGFKLDGIDKREYETNFTYRKKLGTEEVGSNNWKGEIESGKAKLYKQGEKIKSSDLFLVDPEDENAVEELLRDDFRGVYLVRPEEFPESDIVKKNLMIFKKESGNQQTSSDSEISDNKLEKSKKESERMSLEEANKIRDELGIERK